MLVVKAFKMAVAGSGMSLLKKGFKLTKAERKIMKKQSKALQTLKSRVLEVGEICDTPSPYLLVKNGGLMCGVQRQDLINVFNKFGKLDDLIMLPGKSYSYVLFSDAKCAEEAMKNINGQKIPKNKTTDLTFYLAYLLKRPCIELCLSDTSYPPGMVLIENFINEHQEHELLHYFSSCREADGSEETNVSGEQQLKHRYVKHYGYEFIYGSNNVDKDNPLLNRIPNECLPVMEKLALLGCIKHEPDQLTVNEYKPGEGIPPHVDTHSAFEDGIISLSLGAKVAMDFRHPDGRHVSVLLPRRSVLIMTEECRYAWTHGITPRKYDVVNVDEVPSSEKSANTESVHSSNPSNAVTLLPREVRLSLTFRKSRHTPCECKFPAKCDSQNYGHQLISCEGDLDNNDSSKRKCDSLPQSEEDAMNLEKEHVHNVYESIAEHFSGTRHSAWPKIAQFLKEQPPGSIVADVGCGNGKYLGINDELLMFGSDRSQNLATICRQRGYHVIVCDILSLPYRSNSFDVCICIAVIHHLSTATRRLAAIKELARIIRHGGRILISVWALEQNFKNEQNKKNCEDLEKSQSTPIEHKVSSTTNKIEQQASHQFYMPLAAAEKKSCSSSSNVETTAADNVGTADIHHGVSSKTTDDLNCQINIHSDTTVASDNSEDTHRISRPKVSNCDTEVSKVDNTTGILPTSQHSNDNTERSTQGIHKCKFNSSAPTGDSAKLIVNASRGMFEQQDLLIPWHYRGQTNSSKDRTCASNKRFVDHDEQKLNSIAEEKSRNVYQRFYHVFKENELAEECRKLDNISVVRCYYDKGNWCVELEKV